jgi:hypothetical protein
MGGDEEVGWKGRGGDNKQHCFIEGNQGEMLENINELRFAVS